MADLDKTEVSSSVENITCTPDHHEAIKEERVIRHWVIRWMVVFSSFITSMIVSAILYSYVFQKREFEKDLAGGVLDNIFTVLKFMFQ